MRIGRTFSGIGSVPDFRKVRTREANLFARPTIGFDGTALMRLWDRLPAFRYVYRILCDSAFCFQGEFYCDGESSDFETSHAT